MATVTLTPTYSRRSQRISLKNNPQLNSVIDKSFAIATYYIPYHLRCSVKHELLRGLPKHYLIPPQQPSKLFECIVKLCTHLEEENAHFFNGLPERVNVRVENAKSVFMNVSKETFSDGVVNWGRVISIFALAGSLAVHFANKGQLNLVQKIPQWVKEFIAKELLDWIVDQGGWDDLTTKFSDKDGLPTWSRVLAYGSIFAVGYLLFSSGLGK